MLCSLLQRNDGVFSGKVRQSSPVRKWAFYQQKRSRSSFHTLLHLLRKYCSAIPDPGLVRKPLYHREDLRSRNCSGGANLWRRKYDP